MKKGFTLVEVLITVTIFFITMFALYDYVQRYYDILNVEKKKTVVDTNAKQFLNNLLDWLQNAKQDTIEVDGNTLSMKVFKDKGDIASDDVVDVKVEFSNKGIKIYKDEDNYVLFKDMIENYKLLKEEKTITIYFKLDYGFRGYKQDYSIVYNIRD